MLKIWIILQICFTLSFAGPMLVNAPRKNVENLEKIVMDVDAGADDAFAMAIVIKNELYSNGLFENIYDNVSQASMQSIPGYSIECLNFPADVLGSPLREHFRKQDTLPPLIAVTCVHGNTNLKNVKLNVLRTIYQLKRVDIPVYVGTNESLFGTDMTDSFWGEDGFGDFDTDNSNLPSVQKEHAVTALIRLVSANPGQITLMALGPLTNIALAIKLYPYFISKLNKLVILGGTVTGIGNIKPGIEFNALNDPEAFNIVLQKSDYEKVSIFPWDTVVNTNITMDWRLNELGALDSPDMEFLNKAQANDKGVMWQHGDGMAAATYIWPNTVKKIQPLRVSSVTCGEARGGLLVDFYHALENVTTSDVQVILDFDDDEYKTQLMKHFQYDSCCGKTKQPKHNGQSLRG